MVKKAKTPPNEDAEQSKRFIEAAKGMEAAGDANLTEADKALSKLVSAQARGGPCDSD